MNLKKLNEKIRDNLLEIPVIDVASDFPVDLMKIFLKVFEKRINKLYPESKRRNVQEIQDNDNENRNLWFDNFNKFKFHLLSDELAQEMLKKYGKVESRKYDSEIQLYFIGNKAKCRINTNGYYVEFDLNANLKTNEFLNKFMDRFEKIKNAPDPYERSGLKKAMKDPDLFKQPDKEGVKLSKIASSLNLYVSTDTTYRKNKKDFHIEFKYKKFNDIPIKYEEQLNKFNYLFQVEPLIKFIDYMAKYLERNNMFLDFARIESYGVNLGTSFRKNEERHNEVLQGIKNNLYDNRAELKQYNSLSKVLQEIIKDILKKENKQ